MEVQRKGLSAKGTREEARICGVGMENSKYLFAEALCRVRRDLSGGFQCLAKKFGIYWLGGDEP